MANKNKEGINSFYGKFFQEKSPSNSETELNQSKEYNQEEPFGLNFQEKIEEGPKQNPTRSPAKPTRTPRNDGDWSPIDVDF